MTNEEKVQRILEHKRYREYIHESNHARLVFFLITAIIYFGLMLILAFKPSLLSAPSFPGATVTIGVIAGFVVEACAIVLVFAYVKRCNRKIDPILHEIMEDVK